jgi:hypothetical protein
MGTLHNQAPRESRDIDLSIANMFFDEVSELSKKHKMTKQDVIEGLKVLEMRRKNNLYVDNGDTHDEQMSGIGDEIAKIAHSIKDLAFAIEDK